MLYIRNVNWLPFSLHKMRLAMRDIPGSSCMTVSHLLRFFAGYRRTKTKRVGQKINTRSQVYVFFRSFLSWIALWISRRSVDSNFAKILFVDFGHWSLETVRNFAIEDNLQRKWISGKWSTLMHSCNRITLIAFRSFCFNKFWPRLTLQDAVTWLISVMSAVRSI